METHVDCLVSKIYISNKIQLLRSEILDELHAFGGVYLHKLVAWAKAL